MKLKLTKSGVWYGSYKFGILEYIAIVELTILYTIMIYVWLR